MRAVGLLSNINLVSTAHHDLAAMELPMAYFVRNRKSLSLGRLIDVYTEYAPITYAYDPGVTLPVCPRDQTATPK